MRLSAMLPCIPFVRYLLANLPAQTYILDKETYLYKARHVMPFPAVCDDAVWLLTGAYPDRLILVVAGRSSTARRLNEQGYATVCIRPSFMGMRREVVRCFDPRLTPLCDKNRVLTVFSSLARALYPYLNRYGKCYVAMKAVI